MKVLALAADEGGCGFYRMRAPAEELRRLGVDVSVEDAIDCSASMDPDGIVTVDEVKTDADLIIFQRPLDNSMSAVIKQAKRQGIATIVELDDDFSTVHRGNAAHEFMNQSASGNSWVELAASLADHVTVSTPALTKYARHGRYSVLRNYVPQSIFDVQRVPTNFSSDTLELGWSGSVQTHPTDLQETKGAVAHILKHNGLGFSVVGDGEYVRTNLGLADETPLRATGWVNIDLYYENVLSFIDIGIVPLEISPFNQAKSSLKGMEYAALGIPFVASPTREYLRLEAYGVGKTARGPAEWRRHLQRMLDRPSETERIAEDIRGRMEEEHTYRVNASQWLEAWEQAIAYRKNN